VERKAPESRVYRLTLHTFPSTKKADDAAESVKEPGDPLECGILKLGDYRILVTFGLTKKRPDDLAWGLMLIEHTEPNLQLRLLNPEYFEANPKDLPFSRRKAVFDMVDVVTLESSAEQLRLFLRAHAHKPSLWTAPIRWKRRDADQAPQTPVPHRSDSAPDG
jgi:hypothetical protein